MLYLPDYKAPMGKFRVIGTDTFSGGDWIEGDFDTRELAIECADTKKGAWSKTHVYDDKGNQIINK